VDKDFYARVRKAADSLPRGNAPKTAVILGSGLSGVGEGLGLEAIPFAKIQGFPQTGVQGHAGILYLGKDRAVMAGRFHHYEGRPMDDLVLPVFLLKELGVERLVLTNAAGAVNSGYRPGNLVLIKDHLNLMGTNPFIGPNPQDAAGKYLGPRFFDMSRAWPAALRDIAQSAAKEALGAKLPEGIYAALSGPSYETPAEIRMLRTLGADLVGMSTVPEALAASYLGLECLGISCVTNMAAGILDAPLNHAEVIETGKRVEEGLKALISLLLGRL
jgi:purine-nucleoside phosphorylase